MTKYFVIFNPVARGEKARRVRRLLEFKTNHAVTLAPTKSVGDATRLAAEAARDGCRLVVAVGGDGTINEVVNGLGDSGVALGVLPTGTVNVFARELGIPLNVEAAWEVVQHGRIREIDLGCANGRRFVQLAGVGFDALAVEKASWELKKKIGPLSYVWAGLEAIVHPSPPIETSAGPCGMAVLVGNGRFYGGSFRLFPEARMDDGKLDVCVFENIGWFDVMRYAQAALRGAHVRLRDVKYFQTDKLECRAAGIAPFELDGELVGRTPVTISILPRALPVLAP